MPFYRYVKIGLSIVHSLSVTIALLKSSWYKSVNVYSKFKNYFTKGSILSILNTHFKHLFPNYIPDCLYLSILFLISYQYDWK